MVQYKRAEKGAAGANLPVIEKTKCDMVRAESICSNKDTQEMNQSPNLVVIVGKRRLRETRLKTVEGLAVVELHRPRDREQTRLPQYIGKTLRKIDGNRMSRIVTKRREDKFI